METQRQKELAQNLNRVKEKIEAARARSSRAAKELTLLAVSKTKPAEDVAALYACGQLDFGENYVQELVKKAEALPQDIRWHMIGHLQRNKVKYIAPFISMIHSVDSLALLETIEKEAAKCERIIPVLIEVNVGEEESKFGLRFEESKAFIESLPDLPHVSICGLMTSAPYVADAEENRPLFAKLRDLSVDINWKRGNNNSSVLLSMGMSNDYEIAVEEGATCVRVGTDIFGARQYL